jgi:hypothetical protein
MRPLTVPVCYICGDPVPLEDCKTDENGHAVHEECYLVREKLKCPPHDDAEPASPPEA